MQTSGEARRLATLWTLAWDHNRLTCVIYRTDAGMLQLKIELADAVVIAERFEIQPRALARAKALRNALKRRGWREA